MQDDRETPLKTGMYRNVGSTTSSEAATTTQSAGVDTLISPTSVSCLWDSHGKTLVALQLTLDSLPSC